MLASKRHDSFAIPAIPMKICATCNGSFEEGIAYCPTDGTRLTTISKMQESGHSVPAEAVKAAEQERAELGVEDLTGRTVAGRYQISRRLGEGGMGIVYRAVDTRLEKEVAIKVLKEDFAHRQDVVARFTLEAKSAARIKHENILDVTDYGQTEDGSFSIAMELLVGSDLADSLQKTGTIEPYRVAAIMIQVTRALGAAHAKGIVHRDLKPENVFLVPGDDGREIVKIVDFGIAQMKDMSGGGGGESARKLTRTGMIFGTPEYMSPEQASGKQIDHRVDVYAVGVIMYETLAGRVPFVGDTFMGVLTQHMFEPIPPIKSFKPDANVPRDLEAIIDKALAKDANQRYASMQELCDDLVRFRDGQRPSAASFVAMPSADATSRLAAAGISGSGNTPVAPVSHTIESPPSANGTKRTIGMVAGAIALLLVGGAVTVALTRANGGNGSNGQTIAANNGGNGSNNGNANGHQGAVIPAGADAGVAIVPASADAGVAAPTAFRIHVATTPVGARVEVEGSPLRCEQTPCELTVPRGQSLHFVATAPRKRGEITVTPDRDGQEIAIAMQSTGGGNSGSHTQGGTGRNNTANSHSRGACRPGELHVDPATGLMVPCFGG